MKNVNGFSFFGTTPTITPALISDTFAPVTGLKGNAPSISKGISEHFQGVMTTAVEGKLPAGDIAAAAFHLNAAQAILNASLVNVSNGGY